MKKNKLKKSLGVYGLCGRALSACAGGVIGFVLGGPFLAIPGICVGVIAGDLLEKVVGEFT